MVTFLNFFDIQNIFFTIAGYPMSYIEFFGTVFTTLCVWLTVRAKVWSWPVGIIGTILYLFLFYQIRLYSDLIEQMYFLVSGFVGWWVWVHPKQHEATASKERKITKNTPKENLFYLGIIVVGTILLTYVVKNLTHWLPLYFPEPASLPTLDAFTTVMSFVAQWLLIRKKIESWVLWIIVDIIAVWLYWYKDVKFVSLEYVLFFFLAVLGLRSWVKRSHSDAKIVV